VLASLPPGWRNVPSYPQQISYQVAGQVLDVRYEQTAATARAWVDGAELPGLRVLHAQPDRIDLEVANVRRTCRVERVGDTYWVDSPLGTTDLTEMLRFPEPADSAQTGSLLAPMPGTVVSVEVAPGDELRQGSAVVVLEAMKMEHTLHAPTDGVVEVVAVSVGQQVDTGMTLAVITPPAEVD
jgi:biotin carboxyl carrier protein